MHTIITMLACFAAFGVALVYLNWFDRSGHKLWHYAIAVPCVSTLFIAPLYLAATLAGAA